MVDVAFAGNNLANSDLFRSSHDSHSNNAMPGAWFFETESSNGSAVGELSPDYNDDFQLNSLRAALSSRNITESVEVPSADHVAEIVGRQGCKIKALRAKTNTYIKTPVRGDDPIFVVTGKHEDVMDAKREIECAAEHFTQIRASRRLSQGQVNAAPGHVTAYVRVPLRVVGLVVGPKGATIKRIQQDTHTYIVTPSRCKEPVFEVTGLPQNVDAARREIEQHIYQRTGSIPITDQNITSISSYDLKTVTNAVTIASANVANRPNYGALATGTHEMRRKAAWDAIINAQELIRQGQANNDFQAVANGTLLYNNALKK
jgi:RNA-binding protein MEX3